MLQNIKIHGAENSLHFETVQIQIEIRRGRCYSSNFVSTTKKSQAIESHSETQLRQYYENPRSHQGIQRVNAY